MISPVMICFVGNFCAWRCLACAVPFGSIYCFPRTALTRKDTTFSSRVYVRVIHPGGFSPFFSSSLTKVRNHNLLKNSPRPRRKQLTESQYLMVKSLSFLVAWLIDILQTIILDRASKSFTYQDQISVAFTEKIIRPGVLAGSLESQQQHFCSQGTQESKFIQIHSVCL